MAWHVVVGLGVFPLTFLAAFVMWLAVVRPYVRIDRGVVAEISFSRGNNQSKQIVQDYLTAHYIAQRKFRKTLVSAMDPSVAISLCRRADSWCGSVATRALSQPGG